MRCIVDTSRNYNGNPTTDWCNVPTAGIGKPPTSETGVSNIDYFMWIKPPGESDGECTTTGGTSAGSFYLEGFKLLWDQGYFVSEEGKPKIGDSSSIDTQSPSTSAPNSSTGSVNQDQEETLTPTSTLVAGSSDWNQEQSVGTVAPADTEAPTSTPSAIQYTPETTSPSTMAPATETTAPYSSTTPLVTSSPSTTAPIEETTTTKQTGPTQSRSACKAKKSRKRLRSL
eukprot:jgi/Phyca11/503744/fgenesh2_kg.PHYCAscaffold_4_\